MRLLELACDQPSFRTLEFNPTGLTLIVGDGSSDSWSDDGNSNGVGKTLALGLVHHCLGGSGNSVLKAAVPEWIFSLRFEFRGFVHRVDRSGDGKKVWLDGQAVKVTQLRAFLDESGIFSIDKDIPGLSFRSLYKRFARLLQTDCVDPIRTTSETEYEGRLRSLYLLGVDCSLVVSKHEHKLSRDKFAERERSYREEQQLRSMLRTGAQPQVRLQWLDREIPRLQKLMSQFQVAENYRAIEHEANELSGTIRKMEHRIAVLDFQRSNIERSLETHPDISREDLLNLYAGLRAVFQPDVLAHFEAVEAFHGSLSANRKKRLEGDRQQILAEIKRVRSECAAVVRQRDEKLHWLEARRALDEYASLAKQVASLDAERARLNEYLEIAADVQRRTQAIKEKQVEEDRLAQEYLASGPTNDADAVFRQLAQVFYPNAPSGIVLSNNVKDNQVRYDVAVQIEGDDSDGINAARIISFDWLLFMRGSNHAVSCLWHDNRLFADIDPGSRAAWFSYVLRVLPGTGKQYIASINTENFDAMRQLLEKTDWTALQNSVALVLKGDKPQNKLLGVQIGR